MLLDLRSLLEGLPGDVVVLALTRARAVALTVDRTAQLVTSVSRARDLTPARDIRKSVSVARLMTSVRESRPL